jgi:tetratricopeptide (TPR) repeat protein
LPNQPIQLKGLGAGLATRYFRTGDPADLETAITTFQQAIQASPSNSPERPDLLYYLGAGLHARYERTRNLADLDAAITVWEDGWSIPHPRFAAFPVPYQLGQQRQRAEIAAYLEPANLRLPHALSGLQRALEIAEGSKSRLLTQLVGRGSLPLPVGLSSEIAIREQQLLTELTALEPCSKGLIYAQRRA